MSTHKVNECLSGWLTCPFLMTMMCRDSEMGVCRLSSRPGLGIRHLWNKSYWDMHIGFPRYTSGGIASLKVNGGEKGYIMHVQFYWGRQAYRCNCHMQKNSLFDQQYPLDVCEGKCSGHSVVKKTVRDITSMVVPTSKSQMTPSKPHTGWSSPEEGVSVVNGLLWVGNGSTNMDR